MTYGKGLNSIRWRFALASVVLTLVGGAIRAALHGEDLFVSGVSLTLVALAIGAATFFMASRLTAQIAALKRSTEAIAGGDFDAPVEVDCACEVGGLAQSFRKMTSRMNANVLRINTLAYTDPITALPNRSVVDHLLRYALSPERAAPFRGALMFIDLDGFKRVNDTLGHDGGDTLLREASGRILQTGLKRSLETIDTCLDAFGVPCNRLPEDLVFARFAGDEFVAILPGQTGRQALFELANRVLDCLRKPFHIKGQDVMIGASLGIAIAPDDTSDANELLSFADTAMYGAKQDGKGRVRFFDAQVRAQLLLHAETERDLRQALSEQGQLFLHYQPKLHCSDMRLYGVEALVRWQHPRRGLLMPADFIDLAERCGLMAPLGRRVLQLAVAQHTAWAAAGLKLRVAVNASPSQFSDPNFVAEVLSTLQSARMPPEQLTIEVTESLAMQDVGDTLDRLGQLRAAGVHIAIDDFGTGYSNLSQLARMPLDTLKIDRSLVQGIGQGDKRETIVRALIGMTHAMGYRTVAEGVETPQQLALLRSLGCDAVQGFLFARPMAAAALADWAAARSTLPSHEPELCT